MKNISKVIWSAEAVENLEKIITYLEANWTEKEIRKFVKKLEKQITVIKSQPHSFPKSQFIEARKSVLSEQTTIFYKVYADAIYIVTMFDNRQNPENLK
jgi:plasmid stabilization system protein ParE